MVISAWQFKIICQNSYSEDEKGKATFLDFLCKKKKKKLQQFYSLWKFCE